MPVYPISFCIPTVKVLKDIPPKIRDIANVKPHVGGQSMYIYNTEEEYYKDYQDSIMAITTRKSGWDCMRHYEILANGCIPLFPGLENCPPNTMWNFPKQMVIDAMTQVTKENYLPWAKQLLEYTKENLTTLSNAKYILKKSGNEHAKKVLFLTRDISPDYMGSLTIIGFKELFGSDCHEYPRHPYLYSDFLPELTWGVYGKGMTYTRLLSPEQRDTRRDETLYEDIRSHVYDIVIYTEAHKAFLPFLEFVKKYYKPSEIIFICGEDSHTCDFKHTLSDHSVFIREL